MKISKAISILRKHNRWRRGAEMPQTEPKLLGEAIEAIIKYPRLEELELKIIKHALLIVAAQIHNKELIDFMQSVAKKIEKILEVK